MKDYVILPDGTCELSKELREKYNIDFVPGHLTCPDGREILCNLEWTEMTREDFYKELKANPEGFSTAPANVGEFAEFFEKYVKEDKDILCVTISTGISGTYSFACKAKELILEKYPQAKIEVIDSLRFGPGFGLMCINAAILKNEGKSFEEVVEYINVNKNRFHQMGWLDDLTFVARKGRITNSKAFFGTLVGIKPLGEFDSNGLTTVLGKMKGEKMAYKVMLDYIEQTIENPEDQIILIAQTDRLKQAEAYKKMIEERINPKAVYICDVYQSCGVSIGPGLMAAYYVGKPISADLEAEKKLIAELAAK